MKTSTKIINDISSHIHSRIDILIELEEIKNSIDPKLVSIESIKNTQNKINILIKNERRKLLQATESPQAVT